MEETALKKKPQSLNQRHSRLLVDLSAPRLSEEIENSKFKIAGPNNHLDDFPSFAGIADFDSSPDISKLSDHQQSRSSDFLENDVSAHDTNPNLSVVTDFSLDISKFSDHQQSRSSDFLENDVSAHDTNPNFSVVTDFSIDISKLSDHQQSRSSDFLENDVSAHDTNPNFSGVTDFSLVDAFESKKLRTKPNKVKLEGKRRLCKVPTQDDNDGGYKDGNHELQDISDFSSPPRPKEVVSNVDAGGGNEIRDILNDLSSRLEFMSIEKKKNSRPVDQRAVRPVPLHHDSLDGASDIAGYQRNGEMGEFEFTSVDSPFAGLSDQYVSLSRGMQNKELEGDLGRNNFSGVANSSIFACKGKLMTVNKKDNRSQVDSLDGASDRAGYQRNGEMREFEFTSVESPFAGSSDQYVSLSCGMQNKELEGDLGRNNFSGVANSSIFAGKGKLMTANKKHNRSDVASRGKCFSRLKDEGGSDKHDRVMLGSGKLPKKDGCDGVAKKDSTNSSVFEVLDDNANEIVSKEEHAITLNDPRSTYKLPPNISKLMYPHQRDGLRWLWSLHCQGKGGILGDDMGLGKTMQISGYLAGLFNSCLVKRVMIVAPKTLIPHWIKELSVVGLSQKIKEYYGTCLKLRQYELEYVLKNNGILLTTYDIVRNNVKQLCRSDFQEDGDEDGPIWDYMFLDEGHLIKNPSTQRAKSLLEVPCAHRIIISGTPIQNNLKELWALFNFCCPDLLGDKKWFKDKYENPVLRSSDKNASERDRRIGSMVAKELRERIQPYFLRRMKSEVFREDGATESAKLSKKNEIIVWLRLTGFQRHLYEAFLKSELVLSAFDGSPLAAITILKKICDHPSLVTKRAAEDLLEGLDSELNQEDRGLAEKLAKHAANLTIGDDFAEKHDNVSCKISFILSLLEKLIPEGHSVLIFSQTRKMLNLIQESLVANGFEFLRIDGTTKAADRLKIVNEFQEGNSAPIFLLTSQVGGLGLTLTKADRVIVVDPAWNPSTDSQSVDRAYRIGQKKDVIVYRLMTCGTIEEKIYRMQVFKGGLFKTATEHKEQTRYFTKQDLKELFRLPKDGFDISPTQLQLHEEHGHQILMSDYLKSHIKFLEGLGIGGVSHHSLLFSKSEPTPPDVHIEEDAPRRMTTASVRYFSSASTETPVDASQYAFNPKNVDLHKKVPSPEGPYQTESAIRERINRLSQMLSNKVTVSRLPDGGEKIKKQIADLNSKLEDLMTPNKNEVIDLDDISDELERSLHV